MMPKNGWEIRSHNKRILFTLEFWEDDEMSLEFTLTKAQLDDLAHAIVESS